MKLRALLILLLATSVSGGAHTLPPSSSGNLISYWSLEPGVLCALGTFAAWYWLGFEEFRDRGLIGRGLKRWHSWAFLGGLLALGLALVSPLDAWGSALFSAHMVQHEILMLVAAPLIVLGRPTPVFLKALSPGLRRTLLRAGRLSGIARSTRCFSSALVAWMVHGSILWLWHLPALFNRTLQSDLTHALQHLSFFGSAVLFWWAIFDGHQKRIGYGVAVLYVFTTALHSGILGALLTFSRVPWYSAYGNAAYGWGLSPLEDQQLGGLIMWIPASSTYIIAGLALFALWLRESGQRADLSFILKEKIAV